MPNDRPVACSAYTLPRFLTIRRKTERTALRNELHSNSTPRTAATHDQITDWLRQNMPLKPPSSPAAESIAQFHASDETLENFSLDGLAESNLAALEEHLLVCDQCRARLAEIELLKYAHYTGDGPVCARITRLKTGKLMARVWGQDLHGGRAFGSFYAAKEYLSAFFAQMYPEHICKGPCGSPQFGGEPDLRDCAILGWNSAAVNADLCDRILRDLALMHRTGAPLAGRRVLASQRRGLWEPKQ